MIRFFLEEMYGEKESDKVRKERPADGDESLPAGAKER